MIIITFEDIEKRYEKILLSEKNWVDKNKELNFLIKILQKSFLIPIMKSEITSDFRRTKEFRMYIKLLKIRTINLDSLENVDL